MAFDEELVEEFDTILITDEDGIETEFMIIDSLEFEGNTYILVLESALIDDEDAEAMVLKKVAEDGEEDSYELIEDDEEFDKVAKISGIVLTKLDGTAKGGIVVNICKKLGVPVKFIGVGEGIEDLQVFDPHAFAEALFGE